MPYDQVYNAARRDRRETNPLFSDRKLKLGTFCSNLDYGCAMTSIEGAHRISWPSTMALARLADEMEFEAIVPVGRWRGFGGRINFNGAGFEAYSWAAGVGASTRYPGIFATSHVPTVHPIMAAKQGTTIDHITGGRFTLNVVCGWHRPEIEMFGLDLREHDERYEVAAEWLSIIKRLWTEDEEFDVDGRYYRIRRGQLQPKPIQTPHPVVMGAGGSDKGRHFACKHCDVGFVNVEAHDVDGMRKRIDLHRRLAREEYGRDIQVWTNAYVVQGETEKDARDYLRHYVEENGDWDGASNLVETLGLNSLSFDPATINEMKRHFIGGWAGYPIVGTKEQVVDALAMLSTKVGLDGVLLSWARYEEDMREFKEKTLPLAKQAGLR
jgi:alkanesulfonate monooxygenase SsuD/methylene tetrahydromethanopterin reductase-like flavin-dependent oxidoreductase (luciferase family)